MQRPSGRDLHAAVLYRQPASDYGWLRWDGSDLRPQREVGERVCTRPAGKGCGVTEVISMNMKLVAHAAPTRRAVCKSCKPSPWSGLSRRPCPHSCGHFWVAQAFLPVFFLAATLHA